MSKQTEFTRLKTEANGALMGMLWIFELHAR